DRPRRRSSGGRGRRTGARRRGAVGGRASPRRTGARRREALGAGPPQLPARPAGRGGAQGSRPVDQRRPQPGAGCGRRPGREAGGRGACGPDRGRAARPHRGHRATARHPRAPPPRDPGPRRARGPVRGHGLRGGRGSRGGDRLVQLRGSQHAARPSGPQHVGHPLRATGGGRVHPAPDPHVAGADPGDAEPAAAHLHRGAGPLLSPGHPRCPAPAGVPSDRGPRRRPRHHLRRPGRHHRGVHQRVLRPEHPLPPAAVVLPLHRALGGVRGQLHLLRGSGLPGLLAVGLDRAGRLRDGGPQRVRRRRHRPRGVLRLRLRLRDRPLRHDAPRHRRHPPLHRQRHPVPGAIL
ncbi:MAG: Phenylalanyl-tRNA synthetase alpha chain, partial [uncultured Acidimicrobiales bacterium]